MIILYLSFTYPFVIRYLSVCDPILYLSILGFLNSECQCYYYDKEPQLAYCVHIEMSARTVLKNSLIFIRNGNP